MVSHSAREIAIVDTLLPRQPFQAADHAIRETSILGPMIHPLHDPYVGKTYKHFPLTRTRAHYTDLCLHKREVEVGGTPLT